MIKFHHFRWMLPKCISVLIDPVLRCGFQVLFFDNCIIFIFYCKYTFLRRINKEIIKINNHHKQDSKITRSKISYNLIEPQPLPCTTACCYEFHALAVHPLPTFTSHSSFLVFVGSRQGPTRVPGHGFLVFCRVLLGSHSGPGFPVFVASHQGPHQDPASCFSSFCRLPGRGFPVCQNNLFKVLVYNNV